MISRIALALVALCAPPLAPSPAHAQQCPSTRATSMPARLEPLGNTHTCPLGFEIYGYGVRLRILPCPERRVVYPAHGECLGEGLPDHRCEADGTLQVLVDECQCEGFRGTQGGPFCLCTASGTLGVIENFKTVGCPKEFVPGPR